MSWTTPVHLNNQVEPVFCCINYGKYMSAQRFFLSKQSISLPSQGFRSKSSSVGGFTLTRYIWPPWFCKIIQISVVVINRNVDVFLLKRLWGTFLSARLDNIIRKKDFDSDCIYRQRHWLFQELMPKKTPSNLGNPEAFTKSKKANLVSRTFTNSRNSLHAL